MKRKLLGVDFTDLSEGEVLEYIVKKIKKGAEKFFVVTPNPEILVIANKDFGYKNVLNLAELASADGIGIIWASKVLNAGIKHRVTGTDLMESLCREVAKQPITVSFLGGGPKIAEKAAECLRKKYLGLKVVFAGDEMPVNSKLLASDLLFVAFGSPKQEFWIAENLKNLPVKAAIGVGGAFDFASGRVKRAPRWVRELGFEWLFRLIIQPWRLKRQLSLIEFIFLVIEKKLHL